MRRLMLVFVFFLVVVGTINDAKAEKRVALVIGNGAYKLVAALPNPPRDAMAVAGLLKAAGFDEVTVKTDLGVAELRAELRGFARTVVGADIAAVFYAGHGIEVGGHNYIIPIDAKLEFDTDVEDEAIDLDRILQQLEPAKRLKLVILDACRENPFAPRMRSLGQSREIGRGLAPPLRQDADTLVAYAAAAGATAADGDGIHSPFTSALLNNLTLPGLDIRLALGKVRDEVLSATHSRQMPYITGSLGGETLSLAPALIRPTPPAPFDANAQREQVAFKEVMRTDSIVALESFLAEYPRSSSADIVRRERDRLKATAALVVPQLTPAFVEQKPVILASVPGLTFPYFVHMMKAFKSEADRQQFDLIESDAQVSSAKQTADIKAAITNGVKGIVLSVSDVAAMAPALQEAVDAKVPVVTVDRQVPAVRGILAHIGSDNVKGGEAQGNLIVQLFPDGATIVNLQGVSGSRPAIDRNKGLHNVLDRVAAKYKIAFEQTAGFDRARGLSVTEAALAGMASPPQVIVAANDDMALGALEAVKARNLKGIVIIGFDALPEALARVRDGGLAATIEQFPGKQSALGIQTLAEFIKSGKRPYQQQLVLTPIAITKWNLGEAERLGEVK